MASKPVGMGLGLGPQKENFKVEKEKGCDHMWPLASKEGGKIPY